MDYEKDFGGDYSSGFYFRLRRDSGPASTSRKYQSSCG
jgi:hypothetical protein